MPRKNFDSLEDRAGGGRKVKGRGERGRIRGVVGGGGGARQTRRQQANTGSRLLEPSDPIVTEKLLNDTLRGMGLYAAKTVGDGNCMFRALSDQLYGNDTTHAALRQEVCDYMENHPTSFEGFVDTERPFDHYISVMRQRGTYGGHMELTAFARCKGRSVKVIMPEYVYIILPRDESPTPLTDASSNTLRALPHHTSANDLNNNNSSSSNSNGSNSNGHDSAQAGASSSASAVNGADGRPELDEGGMVYVSYHIFEHYSSVRNLSGPHKGLPRVKEVKAPPTPSKRSEPTASTSTDPVIEKSLALVLSSLPADHAIEPERIRQLLDHGKVPWETVVEDLLVEIGTPPVEESEHGRERQGSETTASMVDTKLGASPEAEVEPEQEVEQEAEQETVAVEPVETFGVEEEEEEEAEERDGDDTVMKDVSQKETVPAKPPDQIPFPSPSPAPQSKQIPLPAPSSQNKHRRNWSMESDDPLRLTPSNSLELNAYREPISRRSTPSTINDTIAPGSSGRRIKPMGSSRGKSKSAGKRVLRSSRQDSVDVDDMDESASGSQGTTTGSSASLATSGSGYGEYEVDGDRDVYLDMPDELAGAVPITPTQDQTAINGPTTPVRPIGTRKRQLTSASDSVRMNGRSNRFRGSINTHGGSGGYVVSASSPTHKKQFSVLGKNMPRRESASANHASESVASSTRSASAGQGSAPVLRGKEKREARKKRAELSRRERIEAEAWGVGEDEEDGKGKKAGMTLRARRSGGDDATATKALKELYI